MANKIVRYEITNYHQEQVEIETRGDLQYMPQDAQMVMAHFGSFERTANSTLLYTASIERENGEVMHDYDSEYADDYRALKTGNVEKAY